MPGASPTAYDAQGDGTNPNSMGDLVRGGAVADNFGDNIRAFPDFARIADVVTA
jgi:hypothetical protein